MTRLFGTDGVRGMANDLLTPALAVQLGQAAARVLTRETPAASATSCWVAGPVRGPGAGGGAAGTLPPRG